MALAIVLMLITAVLAVPFPKSTLSTSSKSLTRRDLSGHTIVDQETFRKLTVTEQYAAAAYCQANTAAEAIRTKVICSTGNCPAVQDVGATIIAPVRATPEKYNNMTGVTGFVAHDPVNDAIVISFRGTQSKLDIFRDIGYHLVPTRVICDRCEASYGIWRAWMGVREGVVNILETQPKRKLLITGHSLGGAVASVATAELRQMGYSADMYTYGSPRFGNKYLTDYLTTSSVKQGLNFNVIHSNDPIPQMPMAWMGHSRLFPEYQITSRTNQTVTPADIRIRDPQEPLAGSNLTSDGKIDIEAHGWYFNAISACANGTWLEGGMPSNDEFTDVVVSWMESTGWTLVDWIWGMGNQALNGTLSIMGIPNSPTLPSPTTFLPKDALSALATLLKGSQAGARHVTARIFGARIQ